jgi:hypothetical protein
MSLKVSKVVVRNLEESVIAALDRLLPDSSMPVEKKLVTSKELQARIQSQVDAMRAVNEARAKLAQLIALERSGHAQLIPLLVAVRNYAAGIFGETSADFASFGFKPRKAPERTARSKVEAAEKLRATRIARHTMGKRQRLAIHG